jgi:hypothetical protein
MPAAELLDADAEGPRDNLASVTTDGRMQRSRRAGTSLLTIVNQGRDNYLPAHVTRRGPAETLEQLLGRDAKATAETEQGVRPRDAFPSLELAYRGAMEVGHEAELLLADP